ncbi:hypothetical protein EPN96_06970 [bacterium]|nr:MAG: hypothetical protein EPN96_06970 [bacterium]
MTRIKLLSLSFLLVLFCAPAGFTAVPDWFLSPPKDSVHLFGAGEGATQQEAERHALAEIADRLVISITSEFSTKATQSEEGGKSSFEATSKRKIDTKSLPLDFVSYGVIKSEESAGKIYVLVAVDRAAHAEKVGVEVKEGLGRVRELDELRELEANPLKRAKFDASSLKALDSIMPKALLLDALEGSGDSSYAAVVKGASMRQARLKGDIAGVWMHLTGDPESEDFRTILTDRMAEDRISLAPESCSGNNCVKLTVATRKRKSTEEGAVKIKFEFDITAKGDGGEILSASYFTASGVSFSGEEVAESKALEKARSVLAEASVADILGL